MGQWPQKCVGDVVAQQAEVLPPSCLSCSCDNLVGLTPGTLANDWAIPILQGRPPEEGL